MANKREREFDTGPTNERGMTPDQVKERRDESASEGEDS